MTKQGEIVSQSLPIAKQSSVKKSACSKPLNILVHFECGELELYPMRITAINFVQFYDEVTSTIKSKVPDFKSYHLQFQCGKRSYKFKQDTGFDALCLNKDDPEITIQVVAMSSELKHLGKCFSVELKAINCSYHTYFGKNLLLKFFISGMLHKN